MKTILPDWNINFNYSDSIKIISKQVEKYEELVKELNSFNASYLYSYSGRHKCS